MDDTHLNSTAAGFSDEDGYRDAVARLSDAGARYYDGDGTALVMDDATYDALFKRVARSEADHPEWGTSAAVSSVAGGVSGGDVEHSVAMLSLDNAMDDTELDAWFARLTKVLSGEAVTLVVEPKLDGIAIAARYERGTLTQIITRGDGRSGEDVVAHIGTVRGLPGSVGPDSGLGDRFEVRGEVFLRDADFQSANKARVKAGKSAFVNPRNAAAGAVRNRTEPGRVALSFAAYDLLGFDGSHSAAMAALAGCGFDTANRVLGDTDEATDFTAAKALIVSFEAARPTLGFDIDGAVVKVDDADLRERAGATGKAPRWAIAFKYAPDTRLTTLLDIQVDVGRTGACTPVAVLEPVFVGGTTIEHATLHNASEIARKDLRIGDRVWVRRAGEVIPEIVGPKLDERPKDALPWVMPTTCPRCSAALDQSQQVWRCSNRTCGTAEQIEYFASRGCLDIEGLGTTLVGQLVSSGLVSSVADLYDLTAAKLEKLERVGSKSAEKLLAQIEHSKHQPLSRVFAGLGVRLTGTRMSRRLAAHFGTMDALRSASVEDLAAVAGVGPIRAQSITAEVADLSELINRLIRAGLTMDEPTVGGDATGDGPFVGKTVVVSGSVPGMSRNEAREAVERLGGTSSSSISAKTDLLVAGAGAGSKLAKAEQLGIEIMDAARFSLLAGQ